MWIAYDYAGDNSYGWGTDGDNGKGYGEGLDGVFNGVDSGDGWVK